MSRPTYRTYDVIIPIGTGSPVWAMFALFGAFVAGAVVVLVLVCLAFPSTDYPSVDVTPGAVPTTTVAPIGGAR
ncbi:hypothetical protein [Nocardia salmonicida]|uniref:hypothetical protein n=1 Tax=Nocardia salmonicida TaxID=53431 RepID=UPI0037BDC560